ncbi:MAG TPA: hypothetical protein VGH23_20960 [Rhizomicrobium sp.]|jgi:hypothetical protein
MTKIPVGRTIAHAYGFAFREFPKLLGVMWLAIAITWLPGIFMQRYMAAHLAQMPENGLRQMWPILLPFYLIVMVVLAMQLTGIAKLALGIKQGPAWFYFSLGKPVWRLIGSVLLLLLALVIGWLAVLLAGVTLGFLTTLLTKTVNNSLFSGIAGLVSIVLMIALWCGYIYAVIRLIFLLVPVIAAEEEGFALARSWTLGHRNFWRMFVILLALVGPFLLLELVFIFGFLLHGIPFPPAHASAAQTAAFQAAMNAHATSLVSAMSRNWYLSYPIISIVMIIFYGANIGAQCFAWRVLTEEESSNPVAAD